MQSQREGAAFEPMSHPLAFAPRDVNSGVYQEDPLGSSAFNEHANLQEGSRSFEIGAGLPTDDDEQEQELQQQQQQQQQTAIQVHTTVPRTSPVARRASPVREKKHKPHSENVHVDPRRSATVAAAAAAKQAEKEEAEAEPLTAENESWGHWSFRHAFNGIVMMLIGLYQVVQAGARRQPVDMKTITYTNSVYMPAPPRAEELKKQMESEQGRAEAAP